MSNNEIVVDFDAEKDDSLRIELSRVENVNRGLLLVLNGYIDTYNSSPFQKRVTRAIEAGFVKLIFDCKALSYVSSTGIGSFTAFLKTLKGLGGDLILVGVQPKVHEVFQLLGFAQFFNIRETREEAIAFLSGSGSSGAVHSVFPKVFNCPICGKKLKAVKAGRFRCAACKSILGVDANGKVFLG